MKPKVGLITIGQSPRVDLTPDLKEIWQDSLDIIESGALDDLTEKEIIKLSPQSGETMLVSRLRNGTGVKLSEERLLPLLGEKIAALEKEVDLIILLCTGEFPELNSNVPLLYPDSILRNTVKGILKTGQKLGVLTPERGQIEKSWKTWSQYINSAQLVIESGSPYSEPKLIEDGAERLKLNEPDLIVLDCMGYSQMMKKMVKNITGRQVVLPRTLIARIAAEILL